MKKSELIQKLIEIEEEQWGVKTITMNYIAYLQMQKKLVEKGDVELEWQHKMKLLEELYFIILL